MAENSDGGYESTSLRKGVKEDLKEFKSDAETYSEAIRRAMATATEREDRLKREFAYQNEKLLQQNRLLVRIAAEMGLDKDEIPIGMSNDESLGDVEEQGMDGLAAMLGGGRSAASNEETTDVSEVERRKRQAARFQARDEILADDTGDTLLSGGTYEEGEKEQIEERTVEILSAWKEAERRHEQGRLVKVADDNDNGGAP